MDGHALELTNMRLASKQIRLKPIELSSNPIIKKRRAFHLASNEWVDLSRCGSSNKLISGCVREGHFTGRAFSHFHSVLLSSRNNAKAKLKSNDEDEHCGVLSPQDNSQFSLSAAKSLRDIIACCLMMKPVQPNVIRKSWSERAVKFLSISRNIRYFLPKFHIH